MIDDSEADFSSEGGACSSANHESVCTFPDLTFGRFFPSQNPRASEKPAVSSATTLNTTVLGSTLLLIVFSEPCVVLSNTSVQLPACVYTKRLLQPRTFAPSVQNHNG